MLEFTGGEVQMKQLKEELDLLVKKTGNAEKIIEKASGEKSVFPFSSIGKVMALFYAAIITMCRLRHRNEVYNAKQKQ